MLVGSSHVQKMQKQPFPSKRESKKFEDWGGGEGKNFRTGGGGNFAGGSILLHVRKY